MNEALMGAVGGAIITSLIAPYVLQNRDRRKARAEVLNSLLEVEQARWHDVSHNFFRNKVAKLRASSLIAKSSREVTEYYIYLAGICRQYSEIDAKEGPFKDGSIPGELGDLVKDAVELLTNILWHPWRTMPFRNKSLKKLQNNLKKYKNAYTRRWKSGEEELPIHWGWKI
jgi:hypothetical protein